MLPIGNNGNVGDGSARVSELGHLCCGSEVIAAPFGVHKVQRHRQIKLLQEPVCKPPGISRFYNQAFRQLSGNGQIKTVSIRCMQPVIQSIGNCHAASGGYRKRSAR